MHRSKANNPRLKYNYLLGELDYIVNECLFDYPTITQSRICEEYIKFSDNNLLEELVSLNLDLCQVMKKTFSNVFRVVDDPIEPIFIRLSHLNKSLTPAPAPSLFGLETGHSLKAIESVPIITENSSPFQSNDNVSALVTNDLFLHTEVEELGASYHASIEKIVEMATFEASESKNTGLVREVTDSAELATSVDEEFGDNLPPPPGFEAFVPKIRQRVATQTCDSAVEEFLTFEKDFDEELVRAEKQDIISSENESITQECFPMGTAGFSSVPEVNIDQKLKSEQKEQLSKQIFDLSEFGVSDFLGEVNRSVTSDTNTESHTQVCDVIKQDDVTQSTAAVSDSKNHFYDADFENDADEGNIDIIEPYSVVNGVVVNFEKASAHRKKVIEKVESELSISSVVAKWAKNIIDLPLVIILLKRLHDHYPNGCTVEELCYYEEKMKQDGTHFALTTSVPGVSCFLSIGLLRLEKTGFFKVAPEVIATKIQCLKKNFCSNLYRVLYTNGGTMTVSELMPLLSILAPPSVKLGPESLIRMCNRYPLIFTLHCDRENNYEFDNASVRLNKVIPQWMIQFDCDFNDIDGTLCDCRKCCPSTCTFYVDENTKPSSGSTSIVRAKSLLD